MHAMMMGRTPWVATARLLIAWRAAEAARPAQWTVVVSEKTGGAT